MAKQGNGRHWTLWLVASLALAGGLLAVLLQAADKTLFMPGPLSPGHHQLAESCDTCHTDAFGGGEVLQEACIKCHGDVRVKPDDSHPPTKFEDPRNADRLEKINALACVTCHSEHRPEITRKDGLTQPVDLCVHCHADIAKDRPSHKGMEFTSCKNSGCHNFHNNRALYTDFLIKHLDDPRTRQHAKVPAREFVEMLEEQIDYPRDHYPIEPLKADSADAPKTVKASTKLHRDWLETAHAKSGVNCSACHQLRDGDGKLGSWTDKPGPDNCRTCHAPEVKRFELGKHGMRLAAGLSPMTPARARLPMKDDAAHKDLTCASCHGAHRFETGKAAVEACLGCHADEHSLAYKGSPHHQLWLQEQHGTGGRNTGVSCATCHMPRIDYDVSDWSSRKVIDHNQSAWLSPNSKMIRPACLHCHGLGYSIDALADQTLIRNNFRGSPLIRVKSMELARADMERAEKERAEVAE